MSRVATGHRRILGRRHPTDSEQPRRVRAMALRLIVCGDDFAGKTTLSSSLAEACSKRAVVRQKGKDISKRLGFTGRTVGRTRGIEVHNIEEDGIHISLWDMAGQRVFQAFQGCMFQDSSSQDARPALVLFVWSPVASENEKDGDHNSKEAFHKSLWFWLKLVASSTRRSKVARKAIVAITRKDQRSHVQNLVREEIEALQEKFKGIVEIAGAVAVDARSSSSVKPLAECIFNAAKGVLDGVETYDVCHKVSRHLSSPFGPRNVFRDRPIIEWGDFEKRIEKKFKIRSRDVQKAIASSLHDSGDLIQLGNMLILDVRWFCREMAVKLIHFPESLPPNIIPIKGFAGIDYVENILQDQTTKKVPGSQLVKLMEAMHLCCRDPKNSRRMFVPSTLFTPGSRRPGSPLEWRGSLNGPATYLGRRLECDRKDLTFFSQGLFATLQVLFFKAFGETDKIETDIKLERDVMSICIRDMEVILECGHNAEGEHVIIDVMARGSYASDAGKTLITYVENEIIQTIIQVCKEPVGNQGVKLVEGVIYPESLVVPISLRERGDQCVPTQDLKQQLRRQLEERTRQQRLVYEWKGNRPQPFVELLGVKVVEEAILFYKESLISADEEASQAIGSVLRKQNDEDVRSIGPSSAAASSAVYVGGRTTTPAHDNTQHDDSSEEMGETNTKLVLEEGEYSLQHQVSPDPADHEDMKESLSDENGQPLPAGARLTTGMVSSICRYIDDKFDKFNTKLDELKATVESGHDSIHMKLDVMQGELSQIRNSVLPKIVKVVEQTLYFAVGQEEGKLPRLVDLTDHGEKMGIRRKIVTSVLKGQLKSVHIELFCEHRERPHRVEKQEGLWVTTINDGALKKALPWISDLLKVVALVAKVGAHVLAGASSVIGDIPDLASLIAYGLDTPGLLDDKGFQRACSSKEALLGWQEWLSSVLRDHGGTMSVERKVFQYFKLRRAIYSETSHVAWLCPAHFPTARSNNIKPYPLLSSA